MTVTVHRGRIDDMNITIEHNGAIYHGKVAQIASTMLGEEDHGIFTAYLMCEGDGWGVGVGGYGLDAWDETEKRRVGTAYGLDHISALMTTVGVRKWEDVRGKSVVVLFGSENSLGSAAQGIASLMGNRVLILKEHSDEWRARSGEFADA